MAAPSVGQVVLVPFPFSDLSGKKLRPALVLASAGRGDWICAQITSNPFADSLAIQLGQADFQSGSLHRISYARPGKLFTAHESIFARDAGALTTARMAAVHQAVIALFQDARSSVKP